MIVPEQPEKDSGLGGSRIEIVSANGRRVIVDCDVDVETLLRIIVTRAHTYGASRWEVTLQQRRVRLNVGALLALEPRGKPIRIPERSQPTNFTVSRKVELCQPGWKANAPFEVTMLLRGALLQVVPTFEMSA